MKLIKFFTIIIFLLLITSCGQSKEEKLRAEAKEIAKKTVQETLVDPGSVQFKNLSVDIETFGYIVVCGEYNAKNRMGGYNGFKPFVLNSRAGRLETDISYEEYMDWCSEAK